MNKIKLGVIGTGMAFNRLHWPALQTLADRFEIVAISDKNQKNLEQTRNNIGIKAEDTYSDYNQMLLRHDIDAVIVAVPIFLNYKVSEDVARAGKHVFCEKPLAPDIQQAIQCMRLGEKYNVKVLIAENFRYNEETKVIHDILDQEKIGTITHFVKTTHVNFTEDMKKDHFSAKEWRQHPNFKGGVFLDNSVHDLALIRYLFGGIEYISAFGNEWEEEFSPYSVITASIKFYSGVVGSYTMSMVEEEKQSPLVGLRIFGTKGNIYLEDKTCGAVNIFYNNGSHELVPFTPAKGYYNEFVNFHEALWGHESVLVKPVTEFGDMKLAFDILDSAKQKEVIAVTEKTKYIMQVTEHVKA